MSFIILLITWLCMELLLTWVERRTFEQWVSYPFQMSEFDRLWRNLHMRSHLKIVGLWIRKKTRFCKISFLFKWVLLSPGKQCQQQKRTLNIDYSSKWVVNTKTYLWALLSNSANEGIADRTVNFVSCA